MAKAVIARSTRPSMESVVSKQPACSRLSLLQCNYALFTQVSWLRPRVRLCREAWSRKYKHANTKMEPQSDSRGGSGLVVQGQTCACKLAPPPQSSIIHLGKRLLLRSGAAARVKEANLQCVITALIPPPPQSILRILTCPARKPEWDKRPGHVPALRQSR